MFRLTYQKYGIPLVSYFDDIKSLGQALINIVDNEKEENTAMEWCGNATFGDSIVRKKYRYKIECFSEEALRKNIEINILKPIKDEIRDIDFEYIGWDNDAMTWDIDLKTNMNHLSCLRFNDNYGYHFFIDVDRGYRGYKELASIEGSNKAKAKFIKRAINAIVEAKTIMGYTKDNNSSKKVETNSRTYTIVPCTDNNSSNYKQLDVIVHGKRNNYCKRVTVTLMPGNKLHPNSTGLGNAPKELCEKLLEQFQRMEDRAR